MARLIPRKQIEEQQNISGSLSIQQNVEIGQDAIISGSLFVSKSFFFGNDFLPKIESINIKTGFAIIFDLYAKHLNWCRSPQYNLLFET
jgi:hypothetical protein